MAKKPRKRPYWYFQWIDECPVCGSSDKGRERRYTPKPNDPDQRFAFRQSGCAGGGGCWSLL